MTPEPDDRMESLHRALEGLAQRVDALSVRVMKLEGHEVEAPERTDAAESSPPPKPAVSSTDALPDPVRTEPPLTRPSPVQSATPPSSTPTIPARVEAPPRPRQIPAPSKASGTPWQERRAERARYEFDASKFEWVLGIRGLMLVGVIIVVVGVGMFLKLAHDEGWIAAMSPIAKCGGAAFFGLALVGLGELLRRKLSPLASSGFTAAGIATLFASTYAASRVYDLFGVELAFALLLLTTLTGIVLGAIGQRVMLSLLSLIGAFAVPILLSTGEPSFFVLPAYLLLLLSMGIVLSGWKGGHYAYARQLAWWGTGLIGTAWLVNMHDRALVSALLFIISAWLMTIAELAVSARFFARLRDRIAWDNDNPAGIRIDEKGNRSLDFAGLLTPEARWINALFGATIWAVISAGATIRVQSPDLVFLAPLGFALLGGGVIFGAMRIGHVRRISIEVGKSSPLSLFLSAVLVNSALLLVATIATGLGGWLEVIAWLSVGCAAVESARRLRFRGVGLFGCAMLTFAIARLFTFDLHQAFDDELGISILGISIGAWGAQVLAAALAFGVVSWRSTHKPEQRVAASIALWLLALCVINAQSEQGRVGVYWAILGSGSIWALRAQLFRTLRGVLSINAIAMLALGTSVGVVTQFNDPSGLINPIEIGVLTLAWVAYAALPSAGFVWRTVGASVSLFMVLIALGRIEQEYALERMLLWDAILLAGVVTCGRWLSRWSLTELGSALLLVLACAWGLSEFRAWDDTLTRVPIISQESLTSFIILITMLVGGMMITRLKVASDAIGDVPELRQLLQSALLCASWFMALAVTTLEVVRVLHHWFDSSSAQGAGVSIWWSVFAVGSIALGFRIAKGLRWAGLTLLCIVAGKVLLLDTMTLEPTGRIVASITVGLIIIATGVLYTWLVKRLENGQAPDESAESTPTIADA
jgi:uncharacterized membrane protein